MGGERGRAGNDHHGNSLNRVVTLADFITTRLQAGGQEGTPSQQPATTRVELGMGKDDHPTERTSIADCASFNLLPIGAGDGDATSKDVLGLFWSY